MSRSLFVLLLLLGGSHSVAPAETPPAQPSTAPATSPSTAVEAPPVRKKLIEWGTDEPNTQFLRAHLKEMEQLPFDGVVLHLNGTPYGNFSWETWGPRRYELSEFASCIEDLLASRSGKLTERFIRVNVTPGTADWFDDAAWETIRHNFGVAAAVAKQGECRGLMFDTEQYQGDLFAYQKQPPRPFKEYREQLRRRGQDWIREINRYYPDITILIPFAYTYAKPRPGQTREEAHYGLLADFLDGALEACTPGTRFVDAFEQSYPYRDAEQFAQGYERITETSLNWTIVPEKYRQHFRAGFGVWMDNRLKNEDWDVADFSRNYFTPEQFTASVRAALDRSDEYVWIYTDRPRWWTNENLPKEYIEALKDAKAPATDANENAGDK
ncbi:hypothetical protein [Planctomicrobium sp. SH664]|uniref:hypothetical protein n=1 Tax=Planctomicrobium sp. SH664 TaxID=3448125 RepID=UPI003F5B0E50